MISKLNIISKFLFLLTLLLVCLPNSKKANERVRLKTQFLFPSKMMESIGILKVLNRINTFSGNKIKFRIYEPNSIVPNFELWEAVSQNQLQAAITMPGILAMKIPANTFFADIPFGPSFIEFNVWMEYGGGRELKNKIYGKKGIVSIDCWGLPPETAGWYKKEFDTIEELKGMKIRFMGIGSKVYNKFGINTVSLSSKDLLPELKKGNIDAAEFIRPDADLNQRLFDAVKFNYFPGWHSQNNVGELIINQNIWQKLSPNHQMIIKHVCEANYLNSYVSMNFNQIKPMNELKRKGVKFRNLNNKVLINLRKVWKEVIQEELKKDPLFAEVYSAYQKFRDQYAIWGEKGYLK